MCMCELKGQDDEAQRVVSLLGVCEMCLIPSLQSAKAHR